MIFGKISTFERLIYNWKGKFKYQIIVNKIEKLKKLFNPDETHILLTDFLASEKVRNELSAFLGVNKEKELLDALGVDMFYLPFRDISQNECGLHYYHGPSLYVTDSERICPFGIRWHRKVRNDKFGVDEAIVGPFQKDNLTERDILEFSWPDPAAYDFTPLVEECEQNADRIIVGGLWSAIHGDSVRMMGYENFLLNVALNRPLVKTLVNRVTDFYMEADRKYFEAVKGKMDVFFMGNDFGSQQGLLISEEDWYDIYYENYRKLIDLAKDYNLRIMVHSCGSIEPLITHFIKLGVDILDPVQITANNMDPGILCGKYGRELVFHGAVDTQNILPFGEVEDVKIHCNDLISKFNVYGKYILAPSNNIMPGTPCRNILTIYEIAKNYKSNVGLM